MDGAINRSFHDIEGLILSFYNLYKRIPGEQFFSLKLDWPRVTLGENSILIGLFADAEISRAVKVLGKNKASARTDPLLNSSLNIGHTLRPASKILLMSLHKLNYKSFSGCFYWGKTDFRPNFNGK